MANILGSIITAGIAIMAIALLAMTTGRTLIALPAFNESDPAEAPWANTLTTVSDNAGTAFNLLGIAPLVLGAATIISIIIGAFVFGSSD
ncbi:MAG: hypothetical protein WC343_13570 [Bacilli bacterium]|jgi:hypothetical protein